MTTEPTTRMRMPDETVLTLAREASARFDAYIEANRRPVLERDPAATRHDFTPAADLCAELFYDYLDAHNQTRDQYENGTVGRILRALKEINLAGQQDLQIFLEDVPADAALAGQEVQ